MQVTRNHHSSFMLKVMPLLTVCYFIESYFFLKFGPVQTSKDIIAFVGIGLSGTFIYYYLYDLLHQVVLHTSHLEIRIGLVNIHHEYLYREITDVEITNIQKQFAHVIIHLKNGEKHKLAHVDNPNEIRNFLMGKG